jgi:hypothetical protein
VEVPDVQYAKSGDVNIAYQVTGEGPFDLVFVPGYVTHLELHWAMPSFRPFLERPAVPHPRGGQAARFDPIVPQ